MAFAMNSQDNNNNFIPFDLEAARIQTWWDTIQSRNRYFFELVDMKLNYIENPDLYLLLLEMDDCLDDLDTIECPAVAYHLRDALERSVLNVTLGLIHLGSDKEQEAQIYFSTARVNYKQVLSDYFDIIPY
jgi:hypothetical protein